MDNATSRKRTIRRNAACDECKRRKVRCSAEPQCVNCVRDGKSCIYSSPIHRATDLQKKTERYEALFAKIRRAWTKHCPNITIEEALAELDGTQPESQSSKTAAIDESSPSSATPTADALIESKDSHPQHTESDPGDYEFDESHAFNELADGMGLLTADSARSGYTGPTSGIAAFKLLYSLPSDGQLDAANEGYSQLTSAQLASSYPPQQEIVDEESMINDYFLLYHPAYPLLHEGLFRARVLGAVPKPRDGSWPLLYSMVVAMGAFVGGSAGTNLDLKYYHIARNGISLSLLERGSISYVQGLTLMGNYLQKRSKPNAGFAMIGIAWSMALSIGLHREFGNVSTSPFTMELRRRTWWTLFVFVSGVQLTFGRPPASLVGVNVSPPTNLDDKNLSVDMTALPAEQDGPTCATSLIFQLKLASIGNAVQAELLTHQVPALERVVQLDQQILAWEAGLPRYYNPDVTIPVRFELPKRVLLWRGYHLRIILNRPFLFEAVRDKTEISANQKCLWTCIETADRCVHSIYTFFQNSSDYGRGFAWYATYWLLTASLVHATCLAYVPAHSHADQWQAKLRSAIEVLQSIRHAQAMADQAQRVLSRLLDRALLNTPPRDSWQTDLNSAAFDSGMEGRQGCSTQAFDALFMNEHQIMPETAADLFWLWSQNADTELLNAQGSSVLQNHQNTWGGL